MAFQWRLARSIRNARMLEGELEEENMLERLESEVGKEKSKCWYFTAGNPLTSSLKVRRNFARWTCYPKVIVEFHLKIGWVLS